MLLKEILVNPLRAFLQTLSAIIDVPEIVGGLGLSCANSELSSFKTVLVMTTLAPVVLILGIALSCIIRVVVFKYDRAQTSRSHGYAAMLLLYITLPSTSITIFEAYLCDSRPLGENGEGYLMADYAGRACNTQYNTTKSSRITTLYMPHLCLLRNSELRRRRVQQLYRPILYCCFVHLPCRR